MEHDEFAVARFLDVLLDHLDAEPDRGPHARNRILRMAFAIAFHAAAAMRNDHYMVAPAVGVLKPLADFADTRVVGSERRRLHGSQQ